MEWNKLQEAVFAEIGNNINSPKPFVLTNVFPDIYSGKELAAMLNYRPVIDDRRFHTTFPFETFSWATEPWVSNENAIPPNDIQGLIQGGICYLSDCTRVNRKVNSIAQQIEKATNLDCDTHIYFEIVPKCGRNDNSLFGTHKDTNHNLIIQVEGQTEWKIGNRRAKDSEPQNIDGIADNELMYHVILNPGDCAFIPAHTYHYAESVHNRISLSFAFSDQKKIVKQDRRWIATPWNKEEFSPEELEQLEVDCKKLREHRESKKVK